MKMEDALLIKSVEEFRNTLNRFIQTMDKNIEANKALKMGIIAASDGLSKRLELIAKRGPGDSEANLVQSYDD